MIHNYSAWTSGMASQGVSRLVVDTDVLLLLLLLFLEVCINLLRQETCCHRLIDGSAFVPPPPSQVRWTRHV